MTAVQVRFQSLADTFCEQTIAEQGEHRLARFLELTRQYCRGTSREQIARAARQAAEDIWGHPGPASALLSEIVTGGKRRVSGHGIGRKSQRLLETRVAEPA